MRINQPVTQREFDFPNDATLMSTTDPSSHVKYANEAFVEVSGFTREEIVGQPHNFVRHPDMPSEAFEDMWRTLKGGEPWTALVKNRRKNGDHYWVRANAVPVIRGGRHTGYMSVRTKPSREEINGAERLYRDIREGNAGNRRIFKGILVNTGWKALFTWGKTISVRSRIRLNMLGLWLLLSALGLMFNGLPGMLQSAAGAGVAAVALSWLLEMQLARPLELLRAQALGVATGESREVLMMDRIDEIGMTMRTISQLGLMFRWLIDDVSAQVMTVKTASTEIAAGNSDLSSRTEQSAASVEQTASSMEEMTATVKTNADTASQASALSMRASEAAESGGRVVSQVVSTMNDITQSSKRIADIIGTIDGIAFQTNILALNAAVEAARAGEQGRGFAVVAGEVRTLAQRSSEASKEIRHLIADSVEKVDVGAKLVDEAGKSMDDIVAQVKRVNDLIGEIGVATREQSQGISQVSQAVGHLDQITQQNAALVEQSAAAALSLQRQSEQLVEAVGVFR